METEVLIIGGGPAGATCGSLLRQRGVDCLIVDHADFPRDKVCGGGLTPRDGCCWKGCCQDWNMTTTP